MRCLKFLFAVRNFQNIFEMKFEIIFLRKKIFPFSKTCAMLYTLDLELLCDIYFCQTLWAKCSRNSNLLCILYYWLLSTLSAHNTQSDLL